MKVDGVWDISDDCRVNTIVLGAFLIIQEQQKT